MDKSLEQRELENKRMLELRELQLRSAALARDAGELSADQLSEFAARYASAVRNWMSVKNYRLFGTLALAETVRGDTWVQG